jgi:hypothetical protein
VVAYRNRIAWPPRHRRNPPLCRRRGVVHFDGSPQPDQLFFPRTGTKMMLHPWLTISFVFLFSPIYTTAYTWQFTSPPRQCQNVSIAVQGSGQPPYSLLLIPSGPTPLPNNTEVRTIQNIPFSGSSTSLSFELNYPENSSFVAVVCLYFVLILPSRVVITCRTTRRSVTAVVLAVAGLAPQLLSFNHPTRVVIIPHRASNSPSFSSLIPRAV